MSIRWWSPIVLVLVVGGPLVRVVTAAPQVPAAHPPVLFHSAVRAIEAALAQHEAALPQHEEGPELEVTRLLYQRNGYVPQWTTRGGPAAARVFLEHLERAVEHGLCARPERVYTLREALDRYEAAGDRAEHSAAWPASDVALDLDVRLTLAIATYAWELHAGRNGSADGDGPAEDESRLDFVAATLASARDPHEAEGALSRLEPAHPEYHALRTALRHYRALAADHSWESMPTAVVLRREEPDNGELSLEQGELSSEEMEAVRAVFERLTVTGDLPEEALLPDPVRYTVVLEDAVRRFQKRHGLEVDGIVGPETIGALEVTPHERAAVIALNMDRWRRVPVHEGRHVRVNIPEFRLRALHGHQVDFEMRVVVGTRATQTPVFGDRISYLEFSPDWNVPDRIAREDLVPRIARDPDYLRRMDFEVVDGWHDARVVDPSTIDWAAARTHFPYRLRQRPGSENAMGLVKFMFPNEYVVYLHDTPSTHRFEERQRTFSNGCVRVEEPEALAEWLLDDSAWGLDAVSHAMHDGERERVDLNEPVPVELRYFTAWVDSEHAVQFKPDIYGRDEAALERHRCPRTATQGT